MEKILNFYSTKTWIEGNAVEQVRRISDLPGVNAVAAFPDLHESKGNAVGTAIYTTGIVYPHLVGNDNGCSFSGYQTNLLASKANYNRMVEKLINLDDDLDIDVSRFLIDKGIDPIHTKGIGTIGGGNHYCEILEIKDVCDKEALKHAGFDPLYLIMIIHTGSRSLGEKIYSNYADKFKGIGFKTDSLDFKNWYEEYLNSLKWAEANHQMVAERFSSALGIEILRRFHLPHNTIEPFEDGFLHRKGASPSDRGICPLPGSRGSPTFLLKPLSNKALSSLAHGAGRKTSRSKMHDRIQESSKQMSKTSLGGIVVCNDELLMKEEHPTAYKDINQVLQDLKDFELATDIATLHPVITYKSSPINNYSEKISGRKEEDWRRDRRESGKRRVMRR